MGEWRAAGRGRFAFALGVSVLIGVSVGPRPSRASEAASQPPASPTSETAAMSQGELLRRQGRCAEAIPILQKLIDRQSVSGRRPYRDGDSRRWAQWNIGLCKLAGRDYPGALAAFREARRFPIYADCGNTLREWEYRQNFYEGLALEYLRRAPEAVGYYTQAARHSSDGGPAAGDRLYDLYTASGQLADLRQIAAGNSQVSPIDSVVDRFRVSDLEKSRAWPELINDLRVTHRQGPRVALEALARHGDDTVPLLFAEVDKSVAGRRNIGHWLWLAVGRAATPKTVAVIVRRARTGPGGPELAALIEGLRGAGVSGQEALDELAKDPSEPLRKLLNWKPSDSEDPKREKVTFPPLQTNQRLPVSVTEPPPLETPPPPRADLD